MVIMSYVFWGHPVVIWLLKDNFVVEPEPVGLTMSVAVLGEWAKDGTILFVVMGLVTLDAD